MSIKNMIVAQPHFLEMGPDERLMKKSGKVSAESEIDS